MKTYGLVHLSYSIYIYKCILYLSVNKIVHFILPVKYIDIIYNGVMKAIVIIEWFLFLYVYIYIYIYIKQKTIDD